MCLSNIGNPETMYHDSQLVLNQNAETYIYIVWRFIVIGKVLISSEVCIRPNTQPKTQTFGGLELCISALTRDPGTRDPPVRTLKKRVPDPFFKIRIFS